MIHVIRPRIFGQFLTSEVGGYANRKVAHNLKKKLTCQIHQHPAWHLKSSSNFFPPIVLSFTDIMKYHRPFSPFSPQWNAQTSRCPWPTYVKVLDGTPPICSFFNNFQIGSPPPYRDLVDVRGHCPTHHPSAQNCPYPPSPNGSGHSWASDTSSLWRFKYLCCVGRQLAEFVLQFLHR